MSFDRRAYDALIAFNTAGSLELAERLRNCARGKLCRLPWCARCLERPQKAREARLIKRWADTHKYDDTALRANLRHVTLLHGLAPLNDPVAVRNLVYQSRQVIKSVKKEYGGRLWIDGAFELEPVDLVALARINGVKIDTFRKMHGNTEDPLLEGAHWREVQISVHCHLIVDLGNVAQNAVEASLKELLPAPRQIMFQNLYERQSVSQSVRYLAKYPFKAYREFDVGDVDMTDLRIPDAVLAGLVVVYDLCRGRKGRDGLLITTNCKNHLFKSTNDQGLLVQSVTDWI